MKWKDVYVFLTRVLATSTWHHIFQQCPVSGKPDQDNAKCQAVAVATTAMTMMIRRHPFVLAAFVWSNSSMAAAVPKAGVIRFKQLNLNSTESADTGRT